MISASGFLSFAVPRSWTPRGARRHRPPFPTDAIFVVVV